jgi:two-component system cell cycle sensor histidine kinase/response regulator CckA
MRGSTRLPLPRIPVVEVVSLRLTFPGPEWNEAATVVSADANKGGWLASMKRALGIAKSASASPAAAPAAFEPESIAAPPTSAAAPFDLAREAIVVQDLERRVLYWSRGAERLYRLSCQEAMGRDLHELLHFGSPRELAEARAAVGTDGAWMGVLNQHTKAGADVSVQSCWTSLRDEEGALRAILIVSAETSDTQRLEAKLVRLQRLEGLGFLVSGIAHDLNNVLSPMMVALQGLRDEVRSPRGVRKLDLLDTSATRAASLVRQVLAFARGTEDERMLVQPVRVLHEIQKMLAESLPKTVELEAESGPDLWNIRVDPTQLHQVLLNLCLNARDAISGKGKIRVRVTNIMLDSSFAAMRPNAHPGPFVVFTVSDTGSGIEPELLGRIFDPFFTTKQSNQGTGLGLSTVAAIARSNEGFVEVESVLGVGSTFRVYFPARPTSPVFAVPPRTPPMLGHGETILFVDDEEAVREILREALEHAGYTVLTAADGAEAVAMYARQGDHPAAVVLDMHLPVMDGVTTLHALSRIDPSVKVVATSGLNENESLAKQAGALAFVPKPFTIDNLLVALQQALGGPGAH